MLGKVMLAYRRQFVVTQVELADAIGVPQATISRIEDGRPLDTKNLMKVLNWLLCAPHRAKGE